MSLIEIIDLFYLFLLSLVGWAFFSFLRLPVASFLGTLIILVVLRAVGLDVPYAPSWLLPFLQVMLGIYVGSMVTRKTIRELKPMIGPVLLIILWAQSLVFVVGPFLAKMTELDLFSSLLGFSLTGLAEVSIIALEVEAELGFIILMQMVRMVITIFLLPFIFVKWAGKSQIPVDQPGKVTARDKQNDDSEKRDQKPAILSGIKSILGMDDQSRNEALHEGKNLILKRSFVSRTAARIIKKRFVFKKIFFIAIAAFGGGYLLSRMGIPAGFMVGSIIMVAVISVGLEKTVTITPKVFNFILLGLGIAVADQMSPQKLTMLMDKRLLLIVAFSTLLVFLSSFLIAYLLSRFTKWDLQTCYLAAAPAGFTIMVVLAIKYNKDPFFVSMLHLFRLISIKLIVPFVITWL